MDKLKVIVSGTCHGDLLQKLLATNPAYAARAKTVFVPNYDTTGDRFGPAPVEDLLRALPGCGALIYHDIQAYDFPALLAELPASCPAIRIPYITSKLYWPTHDLTPIWLVKRGPTAYIPFPCLVLNRVVEELRDPDAAFRRYLNLDLAQELDLDAAAKGQMDYLRRIQQGTVFDFVSFTEAHFRHRQLFHLLNHPALDYFVMMAQRILEVLDIPGSISPPPDPFTVQQTPVHPSVIRHHGLTWCTPDTVYNLFDKKLDFAGYLRLYIEAYLERLDRRADA